MTSAQKMMRRVERRQIKRIGEELLEVREPDELARRAERVLGLRGLPQRLAGRPQEKERVIASCGATSR